MTLRFRLPLAALMLLPAPALAQSANDFQLPPAPTPTASPQVQGPVDTEGPVPVRPRVIPTARPTARVPAPAPTPTQAATPAPSPSPTRAAPAAQPTVPAPRETDAPQTSRSTIASQPRATTPAEASAGPSLDTLPPPVVAPTANPPLAVEPEESAGGWWWLGGLGLLALGAGGAAYGVRRRRETAPPPRIEPPLAAAAASPAQGALSLRVEALKLSRSMMNATLDYRLTVLNRSGAALSGVAVEADLASASGEKPMEEQVAGPETALQPRHATPRLAAGQSARFEGQVQLPLAQAGYVWQGRTALLIPLLRLRATAAGADPLARTFVIGQAAPGGARLQPFSLKDGPRSYAPIAQRALD